MLYRCAGACADNSLAYFSAIGWCKDADNAFLVMCLCKGGDLQQLLHHRGRLEPATARNLFWQLGKSLLYLHKRNICHRDLKLSNLLLNQPPTHGTSPRLQLADFGLAVRTRNEQLQHTFCGTPNFLPPEVRPTHGVNFHPDNFHVMSDCLSSRTVYATQNNSTA